MRVYVATTPEAIKALLAGPATFDEYLTPEQFEFDSGVDEEEREHLISLLAAEDSIEMNQGKAGFVIAADLNDEQINGEAITLFFKQVAALLHSEDGEELSWFAPEEIEHQISSWL
jgi:hypothetical protein